MKQSIKSQSEYRLPPFVGAEYEQLGTRSKKQVFEPMKIEVVHRVRERSVDPMFADYGGKIGAFDKVQHAAKPTIGDEDVTVSPMNVVTFEVDQFQEMMDQQYAQGVAAGQAEVRGELEPQLHTVRERFEKLCDDLSAQMRAELKKVEEQAVGLAILISRRIINEAVEINPEYLLPVVREALEYVGGAEVRRVRVSPADLEFVEIEKIRDRFEGVWSFVADPAITSGCVVETNAGEVDYRLDAAWERVKESVLRSVTE